MVEPQPGVALPALTHVVPERVDTLLAIKIADGIEPALIDKLGIRSPALRLDQRIVLPGRRGIDIELGRRDVEVASENHRRARLEQLSRVRMQALEPFQLVVELRPRLRIAVGQVEAAD